jgi:hypothetical protein
VTALDVVAAVGRLGVRLEPLPDGGILATPASHLTEGVRRAIREHRTEVRSVLERIRAQWTSTGVEPREVVTAWPRERRARWAVKVACMIELDHVLESEAERRALEALLAEPPDPDPPAIWSTDDGGPFRIVGDLPPYRDHAELVAAALGAVASMNAALPRDDAVAARAAERLEMVLAELRAVGVAAWLES